MGAVYKGFDPHIRRAVAIKTIHRELLGEEASTGSIAARFRNEAQAVGRVQHPGIVAIYEFGEDQDMAYIAMEYVDGKNLEQILKIAPLLPLAQVLSVMDQLLESLEVAHRAGVWHRDVKPANLLVTSAGQVKLTDFGIARIENLNLTQAWSLIGTPGYMAPEQYTGVEIDHRADLFAAGVVFYRMLAGVQPFVGAMEAVMYKILNEAPTPISQIVPGRLPPGYEELVARAMTKQLGQRFQSATAFRQALKGLPQPQEAGGSDITVIITHLQQRKDAQPATPQGGASGTSLAASSRHTSLSTGVIPPGWDFGEINRIERLLASHVGPMAKLMVRKAAHETSDSGALARLLASHIEQEAARIRFVADVISGVLGATGSRTGAPSSSTSVAPRLAAPAAGQALNDDLIQRATAVLTRHLGPMARIVVKRAAAKAQTREQLHQLLAEASTEVDAAALLRDLQASA
jgi:serine/threonine-protein kinase